MSATIRRPGKREARGLQAIRSEMEAIADDLQCYPGERKREADIRAGLRWIDAALAAAQPKNDPDHA